ncbi:MAG: DNA cytosine methyltransferase [Kiritimatiellae bacterium]|nr:DNA cytosine methyltransferase [Kiritimatiellia bacterium]
MVRLFDLFCGAGGSSLGAVQAGAISVGGLDYWATACRAFELNVKGAKAYCSDVRSFNPKIILAQHGKIDMLLASPECVAHSVARGSRQGCELSRALAFEVIRFARILQPRWLVVENVPLMRNWSLFGVWCNHLRELGYYMRICQLNAFDFGVPQTRIRLFVLGDRESQPRLPRSYCKEFAIARSIVGVGLSDEQAAQFSPVNVPGRSARTLARIQSAVRQVGQNAEFLIVYYGSDRAGGFQTLDRPLRTVTTLDRFALVRPNCKGHEMRMLQPSELAAAMGFPKSFRWPSDITRRDKIKLLGNAVCPPVMRAIVRALLRNR